jgi:hypothetical protein
MKMAKLRGGQTKRSYNSVLNPKERGAHPMSKSCVGPRLVLFLAVKVERIRTSTTAATP